MARGAQKEIFIRIFEFRASSLRSPGRWSPRIGEAVRTARVTGATHARPDPVEARATPRDPSDLPPVARPGGRRRKKKQAARAVGGHTSQIATRQPAVTPSQALCTSSRSSSRGSRRTGSRPPPTSSPISTASVRRHAQILTVGTPLAGQPPRFEKNPSRPPLPS